MYGLHHCSAGKAARVLSASSFIRLEDSLRFYSVLSVGPVLSVFYNWPKFGSMGAEKRSFQAEWCAKYDWLHYDRVADAAFCHLCMTAEHEKRFLASTKRDPAFISRGYTNWKDATTAFSAHLASCCHKQAVEAKELPKQTGDVGENLSTEHEQQKAENRAMFRRILQNVHFLARQGLRVQK